MPVLPPQFYSRRATGDYNAATDTVNPTNLRPPPAPQPIPHVNTIRATGGFALNLATRPYPNAALITKKISTIALDSTRNQYHHYEIDLTANTINYRASVTAQVDAMAYANSTYYIARKNQVFTLTAPTAPSREYVETSVLTLDDDVQIIDMTALDHGNIYILTRTTSPKSSVLISNHVLYSLIPGTTHQHHYENDWSVPTPQRSITRLRQAGSANGITGDLLDYQAPHWQKLGGLNLMDVNFATWILPMTEDGFMLRGRMNQRSTYRGWAEIDNTIPAVWFYLPADTLTPAFFPSDITHSEQISATYGAGHGFYDDGLNTNQRTRPSQTHRYDCIGVDSHRRLWHYGERTVIESSIPKNYPFSHYIGQFNEPIHSLCLNP